ncbi:MAG: toxin-antitoxin system YwqK family antitoxin [Bacteroidetes bacterium]|nr:toxin-antitoxin system YwqK family antitoxin [Bacteroidota bacterium]
MMRIAILGFLIFVSLQLQAQENGKSKLPNVRHTALEFTMDGIALYKGKPFTGSSVLLWENNKVNEQFHWVEGIKEGLYREYTKDGTLVTVLNYSNGTKHGPYEYYYANGPKQSEGTFVNGELDGLVTGYYATGIKKYAVNYSNGIRNGASLTWFKNGAPEQVAFYVNNIPQGEVLEYYPDSLLYSISDFQMGIRNGRHYQFHRRSGCPAMESYYKKGKPDSVKRIWNELNCLLIQEEHYLLGNKHGVFIKYDANGDTLSVENFKNNILDGEFMQWDSRKVAQPVRSRKTGLDVNLYTIERGVDVIGQFSEGKKDGFWRYGMFTNYQHREGNYADDVMVGEWHFFDLNGKLLMKQWYDESGNITKEKKYKRPRKNNK